MNASGDEEDLQNFQEVIQTVHTSPGNQIKFISPKKSQRKLFGSKGKSGSQKKYILSSLEKSPQQFITPSKEKEEEKGEERKKSGIKSKI